MGFKVARQNAIKAIKEGLIQHEARGKVDEKNLLLTGEITPEQVVHLLLACPGSRHASSPHHQISNIEVHIFKPEAQIEPGSPKTRWYIKLYFIEPDVCFISVHR